jgi:diaminohydroxyphosphoribosylaminopyrimidine deaminase/5-amino-6-(5-phosphoribosylamino)uracil reductase
MNADREYMQRALDLAEKGRGRTSPNPMVGCVIVREDQVIGEGYHARAGEAHAEVNAINAASDGIAGTTVYVTLEPCAHYGKTPPCSDLLIERRPARVVVAMLDPNPLVSGKGVESLREAGIAVDVGLMETEARRLNEVFVKFITTGRPFVTAKCGMTLDGKIATRTGHSQWITCEASRRMVHRMRNEVDAIMVGSRTVMFDDPSLTTRMEGGEGHDPVRIILDAEEYLDRNRRVFHLSSSAPTWVAVTKEREYPFAAEVVRVPAGAGGVSMPELMEELGRRGITSLLIEGGGATLASAFEAGIVDKICFFIAPKIVGGRDAITPVEGHGVATMEESVELERVNVSMVDRDILVEAYVKK